jgi:hypothetical protein
MRMTHVLGRGAVLAVLALAACTNAAVDQAVGTTTGTSEVILTRTETGITVQNHVGRPLLNLRVAIEPGGTGAVFLYTLPTLDAGASREIPFADFRSEEGTLFEPGSVAPKEVKATARDTLGNSHNATMPWAR